MHGWKRTLATLSFWIISVGGCPRKYWSMWSRWADETPHFRGTFIWSNSSHLTGKISQKVAEEENSPYFREILDWWNIMIISFDQIRSFPVWGVQHLRQLQVLLLTFPGPKCQSPWRRRAAIAAVFHGNGCCLFKAVTRWVSWSNSWRDFTRKGSWWRKIHGKSSYFQGCPGGWNHIIWPENFAWPRPCVSAILIHLDRNRDIYIYIYISKRFYGPIGSKSKIFLYI